MYLRKGISVRLLSPYGYYPREGFRHHDAAIVIRPDFAVVVTIVEDIVFPEDFYSEIAFASPFEIRALSGLLLASREVVPRLYPTEQPLHLGIPGPESDLTDGPFLDSLVDKFVASFRRNQLLLKRPPYPSGVVNGQPYGFMLNDAVDHKRSKAILEAIDVSDNLLIRGLGSFIQANMLACHQEFLEQACMSLWVCVEASMYLIFRRLEAEGQPDPTTRDAGEYIDRVFGNKQPSSGYFGDFYSDRIKTLHPRSRFGEYPLAPLAADDFYDLNEQLLGLYDFIVTDNVR